MRDPLADIPFLRALGMRLVSAHDGVAEVALQGAPEHENSLGMVHGGVVMTLLDVAMARAARAGGGHGDSGTVVTVEMKTNFFRPASGYLLARGRLLHRSATLAYCEAELLDGEQHLIAKALGTFKYLHRR